MKRHILRGILAATTVSFLSSCSGDLINLLPVLPSSAPVGSSASSSISSMIAPLIATKQRVKVVFYNRLSSNELVPLVPDNLETLRFNGQFSLDGASFPRNKGLEQAFPFIEVGEHVLELSFKNQQPLEVPIVVPRIETSETVIMVILSFDAGGDLVRDVQVGYDLDNNRELDTTMNIYRSANGQSYLVYSPDGRVQEWTSPLLQPSSDNVPVNGEAPLPAGTDTSARVDNQLPINRERTTPPKPVEVPRIPNPRPVPLPAPGS